MASYHLHSDADGESHLSPLALPERDTPAGLVRGISTIPATTMGFARFVGRKPDVGLHEAPRRQFLVILGGVLELISSDGQVAHLVPGDFVLADDIGSKGHISRDAGDDPLMIMSIAIDPEWELPDAGDDGTE